MTTKEKTERGLRNSSLTRVQPFFDCLFKERGNGPAWLSTLLGMATKNKGLADALSVKDCNIIIRTSNKKSSDTKREQQAWDSCFEYSIAPSVAFLKWLINNPNELRWPTTKGERKEFSNPKTQQMRTYLIDHTDEANGKKAQQEALRQIGLISNSKHVVQSVKHKTEAWVRFEGYTRLDCLLETSNFVLAIEGKRTEQVSKSITWYRQRNQIVRILEVLKEYAQDKQYALLLMNEDGIDPIKDDDFIKSLPHFKLSKQKAQEISDHYLGCVSWASACEELGIDTRCLPDTIYDI